jgi:hypothetical protein
MQSPVPFSCAYLPCRGAIAAKSSSGLATNPEAVRKMPLIVSRIERIVTIVGLPPTCAVSCSSQTKCVDCCQQDGLLGSSTNVSSHVPECSAVTNPSASAGAGAAPQREHKCPISKGPRIHPARRGAMARVWTGLRPRSRRKMARSIRPARPF